MKIDSKIFLRCSQGKRIIYRNEKAQKIHLKLKAHKESINRAYIINIEMKIRM